MTKKQLKLIINVYQNYINDFVNITEKDIDRIYLQVAKEDGIDYWNDEIKKLLTKLKTK